MLLLWLKSLPGSMRQQDNLTGDYTGATQHTADLAMLAGKHWALHHTVDNQKFPNATCNPASVP
jgi:hypothetical protein